ncbi:hypothetical protein VNO77_00898 [Canavalia gladiata]|uniref:Uncharacterized protein n=1 Tax=Canavalia gladiata TaxID=3824 RepID=A0AAN9R4U4_CANGL
MEGEDNCSDEVSKTRPVLTDITNRPAKRPFSLISGDDGDSQYKKQGYLGLENLVKKKCQFQFGEQSESRNKDKILLPPKDKEPCFKLPSRSDTSLSQKLNLSNHGNEEQNPLVVGEKGEERSTSGHAIESGNRDLSVANLELPQCGAVEIPTISASSDAKFPGLERCSQLKSDDAGANSIHDVQDLLKSCTCSFCTKALKKSQKEASMIVQKFSGLKDAVMHDLQRSDESSELESSLMLQWKSLFVHMENTYAQESSQLVSFNAITSALLTNNPKRHIPSLKEKVTHINLREKWGGLKPLQLLLSLKPVTALCQEEDSIGEDQVEGGRPRMLGGHKWIT